ncbi:MAG: hypothetical protein NT045_04445 [Candidatus Aureabacteria bacterium]|nr:hypothetical protein [Candidatus Auribacterota bacterium]
MLALVCAASCCCAAPPESKRCCADAPWKGNEKQFVQDMLVRWRDDYATLSIGEIRMMVQEILGGLQPPGDRYSIETVSKGTIVFERDKSALCCTIQRP